jgi:thymidylate synthase
MSKDIPCTLSLQFIIRDGKLNCVATMRSNDIVKGFTYDVFTFSMVSYAALLLLRARGIEVALGELILTAGSLHLYQSDYEKAEEWINSSFMNNNVVTRILKVMAVESYDELLIKLKEAADEKA